MNDLELIKGLLKIIEEGSVMNKSDVHFGEKMRVIEEAQKRLDKADRIQIIPNVIDPIQEHKAALEALGCLVIIWVADDVPGDTPEIRTDRFNDITSDLEDICITRGNEALRDWYPN